MSYKYYNSGSPTFFKSTKDQLTDGFQALLNEQFENSSTVFTIQEETAFASGSMVDTRVRVNRAISSVTGEKLGDDFKSLLFKDITHTIVLGEKYYFDSNWWITVFTEAIKNLAASCTVRRANNILRWVDENGNYFSEPCILEYPVNRPTDSSGTTNPVEVEGFVRLFAQLNDNTKYIKEGQRFLFGNPSNRRCFMVYGSGVKGFLNQETMDDTTGNLLQLVLGANYINEETDDIVNGIADFEKVSYAITTNISGSISGSVNMTYQINPTITRNLIPVEESVTFVISASPIATVSGSGLVTMVSTGSAIITVSMTDNISVYTHIPVIVSASAAVYEVRVSPNTDGYILQEDTETYIVYTYYNGVVQGDVYTFSIADANVPAQNYTFTVISDNSFGVKNEYMFIDAPLLINCVSGSQLEQISILLKGSW